MPALPAGDWPASLPRSVRMKISTWREPGALELRVSPSDDTSSIDVTRAVAGCGRTQQTVRLRACGLSSAPVVGFRKLRPGHRTANTPVVGVDRLRASLEGWTWRYRATPRTRGL